MARNADISVYQLLYDLEEKLKDLEYRTLKIENRFNKNEKCFNPAVDDWMGAALAITHTMRKSLFAVAKLDKCTSSDVSTFTGRHMSVENRYLNELVRIGWLGKERNGKKIYFSVKKAVSNPKIDQLKLDELGVEKIDELA